MSKTEKRAKKVLSPTGHPIIGTVEYLMGRANLDSVQIDNGHLCFEHNGYTRINYDSTTSVRERFSRTHGARTEVENIGDLLFEDEAGGIWNETEILTGKRMKPPKVGRSPESLARVVNRMTPAAARNFVELVAERMLLDLNSKGRPTLNPDKDLDGADTVEFLSSLLQQAGLWPT